ncbi:MAG: hypothetical protein RL277_1925 [Planctomycetota bacterium]
MLAALQWSQKVTVILTQNNLQRQCGRWRRSRAVWPA